MIKGKEEEAVHQCIEAARLDMEHKNAQLLLKVILFIKLILEIFM